MAADIGLVSDAVAVMTNKQSVVIRPGEALYTNEGVSAGVPLGRLAGGRV